MQHCLLSRQEPRLLLSIYRYVMCSPSSSSQLIKSAVRATWPHWILLGDLSPTQNVRVLSPNTFARFYCVFDPTVVARPSPRHAYFYLPSRVSHFTFSPETVLAAFLPLSQPRLRSILSSISSSFSPVRLWRRSIAGPTRRETTMDRRSWTIPLHLTPHASYIS